MRFLNNEASNPIDSFSLHSLTYNEENLRNFPFHLMNLILVVWLSWKFPRLDLYDNLKISIDIYNVTISRTSNSNSYLARNLDNHWLVLNFGGISGFSVWIQTNFLLYFSRWLQSLEEIVLFRCIASRWSLYVERLLETSRRTWAWSCSPRICEIRTLKNQKQKIPMGWWQ